MTESIWFREHPRNPMALDDLDNRLLESFSATFSRPSEVDYSDYDVWEEEVDQLCQGERPFELEGLIPSFASHNRLGMFGDWEDFPPFAGDVAVFCRRESLTFEYDLAPYILHTSPYGMFRALNKSILREWIEDVLMPWNRPIDRGNHLEEWHVIGYFGIYCNLGGKPEFIIKENIDRSQRNRGNTDLINTLSVFKRIEDSLRLNQTRPDPANPRKKFLEDGIRAHLHNYHYCFDNQVLPDHSDDFVSRDSVEKIVASIGLIVEYLS